MLKALLYITATCTLFLSCRKKEIENSQCHSFANLYISKVEGSRTGFINQEINLSLTFNISNGCGKFDHIEQHISGNTITVGLIGEYSGCICTDVYLTGKQIFTLKVATAGKCYLKFLQPNGQYLMDSVFIQ